MTTYLTHFSEGGTYNSISPVIADCLHFVAFLANSGLKDYLISVEESQTRYLPFGKVSFYMGYIPAQLQQSLFSLPELHKSRRCNENASSKVSEGPNLVTPEGHHNGEEDGCLVVAQVSHHAHTTGFAEVAEFAILLAASRAHYPAAVADLRTENNRNRTRSNLGTYLSREALVTVKRYVKHKSHVM